MSDSNRLPLALFYTTFVVCFARIAHTMPSCVDKCVCHLSSISCSSTIPGILPRNISRVRLQALDFTDYQDEQPFGDVSWGSVESLVVLPDKGIQGEDLVRRQFFYIRKGFFSNLTRLRHLTFSSTKLNYSEEGSFVGLEKLRTLDLSDCPRLQVKDVTRGLKGSSLPKLSALYLKRLTKLAVDPARFDEDFFHALKDKPIQSLDLSDIDSTFLSMKEFSNTLPLLRILNIERGGYLLYYVLTAMAWYPDAPSFSNIRELNGNYPTWRNLVMEFQNYITMNNVLIKPKALKKLRVWKARGVVPPGEEVEIHPYTRKSDDRICPKMEFRGKKIAWDLPLCSKKSLESEHDLFHFEHLDLGDNGIAYIDVKFSYFLANVISLDFSRNKLGDKIDELLRSVQMPFKADWKSQLEKLSLSYNGIRYLSKPTDISCIENLKVFNLSYNKLETIVPFVGELHYLELLDLSFNRIHFLGDSVTEINSFLYQLERENSTKKPAVQLSNGGDLVLNLSGNPFKCDCEHKQVIGWLVDHTTWLTNDSLECYLDGSKFSINKWVLPKIEELCMYPIIVGTTSATAVMCVLLISIVTAYMVRRRRRNRKERRFQELIIKYKHDPNRTEFPVFLSFSSRDKDLAHRYIKPRLNRGLQQLLETDDMCVATGDLNFLPGFTITGEMIRCIEAAKVVVFCVSEAFCESEYCREEVMITDCTHTPAILMFLEEVDVAKMSKILEKCYKTSARCKIVVYDRKRYLYPRWNVLCRSIIELFDNEDQV